MWNKFGGRVSWEILQQAFAPLKEQAINGVLIGTAGLWALGYDVNPPDIDILVSRAPEIKEGRVMNGSVEDSVVAWIGNVEIQYIPAVVGEDSHDVAYARREVYLSGHTEENGIIVASSTNILGLKKVVGRAKDRVFLKNWTAKRRCSACGKGGCMPQNHAGWNPNEEGRG